MAGFKQRFDEGWERRMKGLFERSGQKQSWPMRLGIGLVALTYLTTREVLKDRAPMMAASLSFFSVLAVVPLLTVAASLMAAFGLLEAEGGALFDTLYQMFPDVASGIASYLGAVATDSAQAIGGIGAITLLIIGLVLFNAIEETLTRIWRGAHDRSMIIKMLTFYAVISFGPVLIALSIVQTASAQIYLTEMGIDVSLVAKLLPIGYGLVAFTLLFKLVPNAEVKWRAALVGGLYTAVAFELAKWGFNLYVNQLLLQTYNRVYGALALIPIGLIWMYVTWLVILIGAELAYAFQYLEELMRGVIGQRSARSRSDDYVAPHPVTALEILSVVLRSFSRGAGGVSVSEIVTATRLPSHLVEQVIERWVKVQILVPVEGETNGDRSFVPARPAQAMSLDTLVQHFWVGPAENTPPVVEGLSQQYLAASKAFFEGRTALELSGEPESESEPLATTEDRVYPLAEDNSGDDSTTQEHSDGWEDDSSVEKTPAMSEANEPVEA